MLLYFEDPDLLTGAQAYPATPTLTYPTQANLVLRCVTGADMNIPVDLDSMQCTEWRAAVKEGFGTTDAVLTSVSLDSTAAHANVLTIPIQTKTATMYHFTAGRKRSRALLIIQGFRDSTMKLAIQFPVWVESSGIIDILPDEDPETPCTGVTSYNDLTDKPSINGVELVGNVTTEDLGILIPDDPDTPDGTSLKIVEVSELPPVGEEGIIYRVYAEDGTTDNQYNEYYWADGKYELFGASEEVLDGTQWGDTQASSFEWLE